MINSEACPPTVYVKLSFGSNMTRECMSVYQQKAPDSEDFICMSYEESPIGQHMIDFLSVSPKSLPPIVTTIILFTVSSRVLICSTHMTRSTALWTRSITGASSATNSRRI